MPLTLHQLPDDIAALKRLVVAGVAELSAKTAELSAAAAELAAAKNGLVITQLTIEKLKAQIAKFRREKFGASSERIDRALEQLELALEEAEAAKAEAIASPPPQPDAASADAEAPSVETTKPEKKKRRQLPPEFRRRDVTHRPPDVCKRCGGTNLRDVSESVTEVLRYVPGHFEVDRHVRPACSCRKCEAMMQAPMPELHPARHGRCEQTRPQTGPQPQKAPKGPKPLPPFSWPDSAAVLLNNRLGSPGYGVFGLHLPARALCSGTILRNASGHRRATDLKFSNKEI